MNRVYLEQFRWIATQNKRNTKHLRDAKSDRLKMGCQAFILYIFFFFVYNQISLAELDSVNHIIVLKFLEALEEDGKVATPGVYYSFC